MSANWYTYNFYYKNRDSRDQVKNIIENSEFETALEDLGIHHCLEDNESVENLFCKPRYFSLEIQAGTTADLNHSIIKAGKSLGTEFVKIDVFYDQVGEEERIYLYRGKSVNGKQLDNLLAQYEPGAKLRDYIEDADLQSIKKALEQQSPNTIVDGNPLLFIAFDNREFEIFEYLIEKGANPNIKNANSISLLERIIEYHEQDNLPYLSALLKLKLDVNSTLSDGSTPLWHIWAMDKCLAEILQVRGAKYIKPTDAYEDEEGSEILSTAIRHNDSEVIKEQFDSLANDQETLYEIAETCCEVDQLAHFEKLIELGLLPFGDDNDEYGLLTTSASNQSLNIFQWLLTYAVENKIHLEDVGEELVEALAVNPAAFSNLEQLLSIGITSQSTYALHEAISAHAHKNVKLMIDHGIPLQDEDDDQNLLHQYLYEMNAETANILIQAGIDPMAEDYENKTVIERVLIEPDIDAGLKQFFVDYFKQLDQDEQIWLHNFTDNLSAFKSAWQQLTNKEIVNKQQQTLLMSAANHNAIQIIDFLLQQDPNLESKDALGNTALSLAVMSGHTLICEKLLSSGADANANVCLSEDDEEDEDELDSKLIAMMGMEGLNELSQAMGDMTEPVCIKGSQATCLMWTSAEGNNELVNLLLDANADVLALDDEGYSSLYYAVANEHLSTCEILLEKGADINSETDDRGNLLMVATYRELPDMCQFLVEKGLKINRRNGAQNDSALTIAAAVGTLQEIDMISKLLSMGADVNIRNDDDKSALIYACETFNYDAVEVLLKHKAHPNFVDKFGKTAYDYFLEADNDDIPHNIDVNKLQPNSSLIKFVKVAKLLKRFFIRSFVPAILVITLVSFISDTLATILIYGVIIWWSYKLVKFMKKKLSKPKSTQKANDPLSLAFSAISRAMDENDKKQRRNKVIIDSWDDA